MRKVVWDKVAYQSLRSVYKFIQRDSPANAEKVKNGLLKAAHSLSKNPFRHPLDRFKQNNSGNYRAFEKYSYRVAYKVEDEQVIILRLRHVKQEPLKH